MTRESGAENPLVLYECVAVERFSDVHRLVAIVESPLLGSLPAAFARYLIEASAGFGVSMAFGLHRSRPDLNVVVAVDAAWVPSATAVWRRMAQRNPKLVALVLAAGSGVDDPSADSARLATTWEIIRGAGLGFAVRVPLEDFTRVKEALASAWEHDGFACVVLDHEPASKSSQGPKAAE